LFVQQKTVKTAVVPLVYQPYFEGVPVPPDVLYQTACSNDKTTLEFWREQWIRQIQANHAVFKPFSDRSIALLFKKELHRPCVLLGSGPSLKKNAHLLKENRGLLVISCLHNFGFLHDLGVKVDYWVNLDAGEVTIKEVSEGGTRAPEEYWEATKGQTLLTYTGSYPNLLTKWKGNLYFFNAPVPDEKIKEAHDALERFPYYVSSGGNVLGASLYIAKAFLGCSTTIFLGADFSFSYDKKFYGWKTDLDDNPGAQALRITDIFGNKVSTWQSYFNFKCWFEFVTMKVPGEYINCTEGGILGAYNEGNIRTIQQMDLECVLERFSLTDNIKPVIDDKESKDIRILF